MIRWIALVALVALFVGCSDKKTRPRARAGLERRYDRPGPEPGGAERHPQGNPHSANPHANVDMANPHMP